jgi:uncharacterized damage-inducible protein DinB
VTESHSLSFVFDGWNGYNQSLIEAVRPLTREQLMYRSHSEMRSVGELAWHISHGRADWFRRMPAPGSEVLWSAIQALSVDPTEPEALVVWLQRTWGMISETLSSWSVEDLRQSYPHEYQGKVYSVSRQWTVWRILTHDVHHGGQLSELLAAQGLFPLELTLLGGHLAEPEVIG